MIRCSQVLLIAISNRFFCNSSVSFNAMLIAPENSLAVLQKATVPFVKSARSGLKSVETTGFPEPRYSKSFNGKYDCLPRLF